MKLTTITITLLLPTLALAEPQPRPPGPGGSCGHGWLSSGSFCVPQDAVSKPPNGNSPWVPAQRPVKSRGKTKGVRYVTDKPTEGKHMNDDDERPWERDEDAWIADRRKSGLIRDITDECIARERFRSYNATMKALADKRSRPRRVSAPRKPPSLTRALREAKKAGVNVAAATITSQGVALTFGEAATGSDANPWDEVLKNVAN